MDILNGIANIFCIMLLSYLIGSFPTSFIVGKILRGIDIRRHGSGNAGGTNSFRVLGWKAGILVVSVDIFKGFCSAYWVSQISFFNTSIDLSALLPAAAGFAAVVGHCFTIFAGFKGGKGVATSAGMLIAISPTAFFICFGVFILALLSSGYVSLGSLSTAAVLPIALLILMITTEEVSLPFFIFGTLSSVLVFYAHRGNIERLLNGTENRFNSIRIFYKKRA